MQKQWSSFRITLLLYLVVLILPFSFYFVYTSFKTIQEDTKIVRQSSWVAGIMGHTTYENEKQTIVNADKALKNIATWSAKNGDTKLYIGAHTLSEDLSKVTSCWNKYKSDPASLDTKCYPLADNMALNIEKMVYMKQNRIINIYKFFKVYYIYSL